MYHSHTVAILYAQPRKKIAIPLKTQHRQYQASLNIEGPYHFPVTTPMAVIGRSRNAVKASVKPKGWVVSEVRMCPCAKSETAVVQPQVGQGKPVLAYKSHGSKPNCVCVSVPVGLGVKYRPTANIPAQSVSTNPHQIRTANGNGPSSTCTGGGGGGGASVITGESDMQTMIPISTQCRRARSSRFSVFFIAGTWFFGCQNSTQR